MKRFTPEAAHALAKQQRECLMALAEPHPRYQFYPGDLVRLSALFLKSSGQVNAKGQMLTDEAEKVFKVQAVEGDFIVTDELRLDLDYWTPEELEAEPLLKFRRIHSSHLVRAYTTSVRDDP